MTWISIIALCVCTTFHPDYVDKLSMLAEKSERPMVASYYKLHGRKMANGKKFDKNNKRLAAHPKYEFGTKLRLTYYKGGKKKTLVVEICDRGPFVTGRDLDISEAAADFLGFKKSGLAILLVKVIKH